MTVEEAIGEEILSKLKDIEEKNIKREKLLHDFLEKHNGVESLTGADILKYEKDIKKLSDAFNNVEIKEK